MSESFFDGRVVLHPGDCREVLAALPADSIDAVVTDPPYHLTSIVKRFGNEQPRSNMHDKDRGDIKALQYKRLAKGFMGKQWDGGDIAFTPELWTQVLRVMKPGAHLVAFGGTRTFHRLACAIEDAGFEVRDAIMWHYGSGFPKSHDLAKDLDKRAGYWRGRAGEVVIEEQCAKGTEYERTDKGEPITTAARQWAGWGSALKPASELIALCTKPLTVRQLFGIVLEHITWEIMQCSNLPVSDAERLFGDSLAKQSEASHSVLASAKINVLESIGLAQFAGAGSTFSAPVSFGSTKIRDCSVLVNVKGCGSGDSAESKVSHGEVGDLLTRNMDMFTSVLIDGISQNIATSWSKLSDDLLSGANRFTIETVSKLITGLRTWKSLTHQITSSVTGSLSPSTEIICLARKPLSEPTIAANVLRWGTGAINVDGCRIGMSREDAQTIANMGGFGKSAYQRQPGNALQLSVDPMPCQDAAPHALGRWPANLCHDGSEEVLAGFPESTSGRLEPHHAPERRKGGTGIYGTYNGLQSPAQPFGGDSGSAARFFYTAKADASDRIASKHPTVKPVDLMQWLCRLITPAGGTILDPFSGTGTTGEAAFREGFNAVLIEREAEYQEDIRRRMKLVLAGPDEKRGAIAKQEDHTSLPLFGSLA